MSSISCGNPTGSFVETTRPAASIDAGQRGFFASLFGSGPMQRRQVLPNDRGDCLSTSSFSESWAAGIALGDRRRVARGNPYPVNRDIEALYASARAAGGAIAFDPSGDVIVDHEIGEGVRRFPEDAR